MLALQPLLEAQQTLVHRLLRGALDDGSLACLLCRHLGEILVGVEAAGGGDGGICVGEALELTRDGRCDLGRRQVEDDSRRDRLERLTPLPQREQPLVDGLSLAVHDRRFQQPDEIRHRRLGVDAVAA